MNILDFFKKNQLLTIVVVSFVVSAVVGGVFGYYAGVSVGLDGNASFLAPFGRFKEKDGNTKLLASEETKIVEIVKQAIPAVVSIVATKDLTIVERRGVFNPFEEFCDDPFFRQFFGNQCDSRSQPPKSRTEKQQISAGSGFLISSDGLILTNKHVVDTLDADYIAITSDGKKHSAKILAKDPIQDLALLKITGVSYPSLLLGDSSKLQIGQTVVAIGNALGEFSNTVSRGVISGLSRSIVASERGRSEKLDQVIQTDAAINPGNSGGPLLSLYGEVIGVNTAIVQGAQNIGFAIPINQAKRDINQVKQIGKISYPFLGVRYVLVNGEIKEKNNLPIDYGALVVRGDTQTDLAVIPGSPADKAGLRENDIILEINSKKVNQDNDLAKQIQLLSVGQVINLKILSRGEEKLVQVKLEERTN